MEKISIQEDRLDQIKRAQVNYQKTPKARITLGYLETRLEILEKIYSLFNITHEEITMSIRRDQRSTYDYFKSDLFEEFEEVYTTYKSAIKDKIKEFMKDKNIHDNSPGPSTAITNTEVKLPTINIPTFSGKYTDWPSFHDLFTSIIHKNKALDEVQKLHYLKSLVSGEAEQLLKSITVTNENYIQAWESLKRRYNNKRYISNCIFKRLFGLKSITTESSHLLKQLIDTTAECLSALTNLGINTDSWDAIIIYLTVSKLDCTSHRLWEQHISSEVEIMPTFTMLYQFIETRFRSLEMLENNSKGNKPSVQHKTFHASTEPTKCGFCSGDHYIFQCKQFAKLSYNERQGFVYDHKLCFNCLTPNHSAFKCLRNTCCRICKRKHHSLLHPEKKENTHITQKRVEDIQEEKNIVTHFVNQPGQVLLATALVDITWKDKQTQVYRALIDQGSQASFVTENLVQSVGLKRIKINGVVSGLSEGSKLCTKYIVELEIRSRTNPHFTVLVKAYVLKKITNYLPSQQFTMSNWPELKSITLADPSFNQPQKIDLLLGAEVYAEIIDGGLLKSPCGVVAQNTHLGWILSGDTNKKQPKKQNIIVNMHICEHTNKLLKKFWEIENDTINSQRKQTKEEKRCEEIYKKTTIKTDQNRYKVYLPFKEDCDRPEVKCGKTKEIAISRFLNLERKFERDPVLKEEYIKVMQEYLQLGHMEQVDEYSDKAIYLPHHAVIRNDKDTTKTRVVFDASAKGSKGYSLNDTLLTGPTLQKDLRTLIMEWRQYKIVIVSDLIKMYRQILVTENHTDYQRIVWRDNPNEECKSYRLLTVTFGTASAPYLAVRTLLQTAEDNYDQYPLASEITKNCFYMDDLLTGCYDVEEGNDIYNQLNALLERGGFKLRKWCSNSNDLLMKMSKDKEIVKDTYEIKFDDIVKILGLAWHRDQDTFEFSVDLPTITEPITKRKVLSYVARLFDPFGWLSPVIITAKILLQKLWLCHSAWDDSLPPKLLNEWQEFRSHITEVKNIKLNRWLYTYPDRGLVELHGFADASTLAYAAVVYVRVLSEDGEVKISLLESKTKVAPLKQVSVARLELCAALLLAKLLSHAAATLKIPSNQVYAYTDSMVTLAWIEGQPTKWQTFVANRVTEIQSLLNNTSWHHVPSKENPADLASRGVQPCELINSNLWWKGPQWLGDRQIYFNKIIPETNLEVRKQKIQNYHHEVNEELVTRFSSLTKMIRVLTYCRRFLNLKGRNKENKPKYTYLTSEEMKETLKTCIKISQNQDFLEEINDLKEKHNIKTRSKLLTLSPYLDNEQILRVGGRLQGARISTEIKHPIILSKNTHLSVLIVRDAHLKLLHGGNSLMLNYLRNSYWILGLKSMIKKCIQECVTCVRHKALTLQPKMGGLPVARISPGRPFECSGVDFAGPIQMRTYKGRGHKSFKGYICLFICMKTKAIHLEVVSDLTSKGFLAAFRRFVSRRGHCAHMWSDNGLNFVGADKELRDLFNQGKSMLVHEISEMLSNDGTTWHFIPPRAPNFGGLWEAAVKSVKSHLIKVVGNVTLTFEEMTTLLTQIEACLNSRPLCEISNHPDDLMPLTPAHFLIGESSIIIPETNYENSNVGNLDRWKLVQKMTQHFWRRWSNEYLHSLQQRRKWHKSVTSPSIGELVLIKDKDLPPAKWLMGRIIKLYYGPDNEVRVADLKCKTSTLTRPLSKLILLPNDKEKQDQMKN